MAQPQKSPWRQEFDDLLRAIAAGFLFSIPLFYTMEVWAIGSYATEHHTLMVLGLMIVLIMLLNKVAGFREDHHQQHKVIVIDSVTLVALSILSSAFLLWLLREITWDTGFMIGLRQAIYGAVPFAMGMGIANNYLQPSGAEQNNEQGGSGSGKTALKDLAAAAIGALFVGFNIAPTEEIRLIAARMSPVWLILVMFFSLLVSYLIVFVAHFGDQQARHKQAGFFQHPWSETVFAYIVSLLMAVAMLWFFEQLTFSDPWTLWLAQAIVLGVPATIGGAAGRLAV